MRKELKLYESMPGSFSQVAEYRVALGDFMKSKFKFLYIFTTSLVFVLLSDGTKAQIPAPAATAASGEASAALMAAIKAKDDAEKSAADAQAIANKYASISKLKANEANAAQAELGAEQLPAAPPVELDAKAKADQDVIDANLFVEQTAADAKAAAEDAALAAKLKEQLPKEYDAGKAEVVAAMRVGNPQAIREAQAKLDLLGNITNRTAALDLRINAKAAADVAAADAIAAAQAAKAAAASIAATASATTAATGPAPTLSPAQKKALDARAAARQAAAVAARAQLALDAKNAKFAKAKADYDAAQAKMNELVGPNQNSAGQDSASNSSSSTDGNIPSNNADASSQLSSDGTE
jgi:trimeric autotransporter adhesin